MATGDGIITENSLISRLGWRFKHHWVTTSNLHFFYNDYHPPIHLQNILMWPRAVRMLAGGWRISFVINKLTISTIWEDVSDAIFLKDHVGFLPLRIHLAAFKQWIADQVFLSHAHSLDKSRLPKLINIRIIYLPRLVLRFGVFSIDVRDFRCYLKYSCCCGSGDVNPW